MTPRFEEPTGSFQELVAAFLRAGSYIRGWSKRTVSTYADGLQLLGPFVEAVPTKASLDAWLLSQRERGRSAGGCNLHIRSVNSFLTWLHEEGHIPTALRMKLLRAPQPQVTVLSSADVGLLLRFRPKTLTQHRAQLLTLLMLDCGIRLSEAITLQRAKVDLDAMTIVVFGKGAKERVVPISLEIRKRLFPWMQRGCAAGSPLVFPTRNGQPLMRRNVLRDVVNVCRRVGITKRVHPHLFRHTFAVSYIQRGGDVYRLSRTLGHGSISTTATYLRGMGIEQLKEHHNELSPLTMRPA